MGGTIMVRLNASVQKSFLALALSLGLCRVLMAQPTELSMSRDQQAEIFIKIWTDTCAKYFANSEELKTTAKAFRFQENPPYASNILGGVPGTVWDVSLGPAAQNAVILFNDGRCQVRASRATNSLVLDAFEKVITGADRPGLFVTKVLDADTVQAGSKFRQVSYFLSKTNADVGWAFTATLTESTTVSFQAIITIGQARKPEK
jgi:hypothetical protein